MRRLLLPTALAVSLTLVAAGCGGTDDEHPGRLPERLGRLPAGAGGALPAQVRLAGGTPISECLAENQPAGDLAAVGDAMLDAATALNAEARAEPAERRTCGSAT